MAASTGYSLLHYGRMVTDAARLDAYAAALQQVITPESVVADLGAGPGFFALLAAGLGASEVHAVDPVDAILLARTFADANGLGNRIHVHRCLSTELELSPRADVIVSDLRGITPLLQHHIAAIIDARERLLQPGGSLIPRCDRIFVALLHEPEHYADCDAPWSQDWHGLDLRAGRDVVVNAPAKVRATSTQLCSEPALWTTLDYRTITASNVAGTVSLSATRSEAVHGIAVWFDTELAEGIGYSNAPGSAVRTYGQFFLPFLHPLQLTGGDVVEVDLSATLVGDDYVWRWMTTAPGARFEQSTFLGEILDADALVLRHPDARPVLDEAGQADAFILARLDGTNTLGDVAAAAQAAFPTRFTNLDAARARVGDLAVRYAGRR